MKRYILFNPLSGNGKSEDDSELLAKYYGGECELKDITGITDYAAFFSGLTDEDSVVICGGDGTLNRFVNNTVGIDIKCKILYHASGTGNDFLHDIQGNEPGDPIDVGRYLKDLPTVTVNGKSYKFINNVGFGIDGYCCEVGDEQKLTSDKPVNYTMIAIKGLLLHYKPTGATVTVDGKEYRYENVWLAPTMKGRFYGGGMMPTPDQDRCDPNGELSVMLMYKKSKLKTLMVFPSIFKGEHVKHENMVAVHKGKNIKVVFDTPAAVQIDGETIRGVTSYEAAASAITADAAETAPRGYDTAIISFDQQSNKGLMPKHQSFLLLR